MFVCFLTRLFVCLTENITSYYHSTTKKNFLNLLDHVPQITSKNKFIATSARFQKKPVDFI